jgi:hypothetical protein
MCLQNPKNCGRTVFLIVTPTYQNESKKTYMVGKTHEWEICKRRGVKGGDSWRLVWLHCWWTWAASLCRRPPPSPAFSYPIVGRPLCGDSRKTYALPFNGFEYQNHHLELSSYRIYRTITVAHSSKSNPRGHFYTVTSGHRFLGLLDFTVWRNSRWARRFPQQSLASSRLPLGMIGRK